MAGSLTPQLAHVSPARKRGGLVGRGGPRGWRASAFGTDGKPDLASRASKQFPRFAVGSGEPNAAPFSEGPAGWRAGGGRGDREHASPDTPTPSLHSAQDFQQPILVSGVVLRP